MSYSQFGQDLWVFEYFNTGIFVDDCFVHKSVKDGSFL